MSGRQEKRRRREVAKVRAELVRAIRGEDQPLPTWMKEFTKIRPQDMIP